MSTDSTPDDEISDAEPSPEDDVLMSDGESAIDEDCRSSDDGGDEMDEEDGADTPSAASSAAKAARAEKSDGKRKSSSHKDCKNPGEAAERRIRRIGLKLKRELDLRADIKPEVLNWLILDMQKEERASLRKLGAMEQEHYLAKRDCVDFLETNCYNAFNSVDLRANEALSIRLINTIRERLACGPDGKRLIICRPPAYGKGRGNLTRKSNR